MSNWEKGSNEAYIKWVNKNGVSDVVMTLILSDNPFQHNGLRWSINIDDIDSLITC